MKRSNLMISIASFAMFAAVALYFAVYIYNTVANPMESMTAARYTVRDSCTVSGLVVRSETVLTSDYEIVDVTVGEGERVAAWQQVAGVYSSTAELERASERRRLEQQVSRLQKLLDAGQAADASSADASIKRTLIALSGAVSSRSLSDVDGIATDLQGLLYGQSGGESALESRIGELQAQLSALGGLSAADTIYAPLSGLYSATVDGYEGVTPAYLDTMTTATLSSLLERDMPVSGSAIGKLVSGSYWYYAAAVPEEEAAKLTVGKSVTMVFGSYLKTELKMKVRRIGETENGKRIVVFSCDRALSETLSLRSQQADIIYSAQSGIRVSKRSIHLDEDGNTVVYTITGLQAEQKPVEIICEFGDYYLVRDGGDGKDALRVGNEVIIGGKELYDGKVVG